MGTEKRFFKNTKKHVGNKSVIIREKKASQQKQTQKEEKNQQKEEIFPKNSQLITERPQQPRSHGKSFYSWIKPIGLIVVVLISLGACTILGMQVWKVSTIIKNRVTLQCELQLWEDISNKYPTYRDADFQVAILAYRLGDRTKMVEYVEKTLAIDPNFEPAKRLEE